MYKVYVFNICLYEALFGAIDFAIYLTKLNHEKPERGPNIP
jgi:hypothetical protein